MLSPAGPTNSKRAAKNTGLQKLFSPMLRFAADNVAPPTSVISTMVETQSSLKEPRSARLDDTRSGFSFNLRGDAKHVSHSRTLRGWPTARP